MKTRWLLMAAIAACVGCGCSANKGADSVVHEDAEGEESGPSIAIDATHDTVRRGVRLILKFDTESASFVGTAQNVTEEPVPAVRVEVHLSNGTELGPTPRNTLEPGQTREITLSAKGQQFETWKAHAESGEGAEHGHGREGEGEHGGGGEGEGEHGASREHR